MSSQKIIRGRYEIQAVIGRGGMGVVYRAFDPVMKRDVAIKTLHDVSSQPVLDLFYRECDILRGIVHPNVVDILDMGDFEEEGVTKPYYVMPLLPGKTLYDLLHPSKDVVEPLSVDRAVEVIVQTSRGLHAAHERELLHRDVKPRNIFVIDEYSVKLIDFGVAHLLGSNSSTGVKGTLEYMAPEQLRMKPLSRRTDIFSLATVCYEILTGVQPFRRPTEGETAAAVANAHPPLACDVKPSVPKPISQVISKAMAKEPWSRFATAAEFAEALQRARRNEPLNDLFDPSETRIRVERARHSFEEKDYQFASEVLRELEAEGQAEGEVLELRKKVDEALLQQTTGSLLETAERYFRAEEYSLAIRKVQEILDLDAKHAGALGLKKKIEEVLSERKVIELIQIAGERLERAAFTEARKALQDAQKLRPEDTRVRQLLSEVDSRQKDFLRQRQEQERLYQSSQAAWVQRDISQALVNLERLTELARQTPEPRDRLAEYENFYKLVRTEHDALLAALEQAREKVAAEDFGGALALCGQYLGKYPRHAGFAELKAEIENKQREKQAAFRAEVERRVDEEPNLDRQVQMLEEAAERYPQEPFYGERLRRVRSRQGEVSSVLEVAQVAEDAGDFDEALAQWARLRSLYPQFPGLDEQVARVTDAREQARAAAKARWADDIEQALSHEDLGQAARLLDKASAHFPGEYESQRERLEQIRSRKTEARRCLAEARSFAAAEKSTEALDAFRKAYETDAKDAEFRKSVLDAMVEQAQSCVGSDWRAADQYLRAARTLDQAFSVPKEVSARVEEGQRSEFVGGVLTRAAGFEKASDFKAALHEIDVGLARYPREKSLKEKRWTIEAAQLESARQRERETALQRARELARHAMTNLSASELEKTLEEVRGLARKYANDPELYRIAVDTGQQLLDLQQARAKVAAGDLEGAGAVADRYLAQFPQHAGFQDVQSQIADRERQIAGEYMDEVNKSLFAEPNLDRRVQILEEALRRYSDEPHYRQELELVRDEQKLVRSIVDEANSLEQAGQFKDALDQWNRLRTIYRFYPDLDQQIARLTELHEQVRREAKARWREQIGQAVHDWNFAQALEWIRRAEVEFPGEFSDLAGQVKQGADRRARAQQLIAEAQEPAGKAHWEDVQTKLREAVEGAAADPVVLKQVTAAHAKHARSAIKSDWKAAEALLEQAGAIDGSFKAPAELRAKIEERKHAEFVEQTLGQSRQLQQNGNLQGALDVVLQALATYPDEARLLQRKQHLEIDLRQAAMEQERERALEELRQLEGVTRTIADRGQLRRILDRAEGIAREHGKDREVSAVSSTIREQVEALQRARQSLEEGNHEESEKIADAMLGRFPGHSAFAALKQEIQSARDQAAAAYLDEVTRKLGETRQLKQREAILLEAAQLYPKEPYYQQELDLLREKQRLVTEIVKRASEAEKAARYEEALDQWKSMRAVDADYPDLETQIARLAQLHGHIREEVKARRRDEVQQALNERNYGRALELIRGVQADFPGEFNDLESQAKQGADRKARAEQLIAEAQQLAGQGQWAQVPPRLQQAVEADPDDPAIVKQVIAAHGKYARNAFKADWKTAGVLLDQAAALDPTFKAPADLRTKIDERKRTDFIDQSIEQSKQLEQAGQLQSALDAVLKALETYPDDHRLSQRKERLEADLRQAAAEQEQQRALEELHKREGSTRTIAMPTVPPARPEPQIPPHVEPPAHAGGFNRKPIFIIGGIAAVVALGIIVIPRMMRTGGQIPVSVTSNVSGAAVSVGGQNCVTPNCALTLAPGSYPLTAKKDGFKAIAQTITIESQQNEVKLPLTFEPLPQVLQVNTNFESGRVFLDGRAAGDLRDGQFSLTGVAPGDHTLRVTGGSAEFRAEFRSAAGSQPELVKPVEAKEVQATVVANAGGSASIACNCDPGSVTVDGAAAGQTASAGAAAPLKNLAEGARTINIGGHSLVVDVRPNPALNVFLSLDRNVGTLIIETAEDNARVYLNNKLYRRTTEHGTLRIPVDVGSYSVRIEKDGFQASPAQTVDVKKGEEKRAVWTLRVVPPVMEIVGALPAAQVRVDGRAVGETGANGSLRTEVTPGEHVIEITKEDYTPARFTAQFAPGKTTRPENTQIAMARVVRTPAPPPPPDPKQIESADWEKVRASNSPETFDDFVRRHPDGAHVEEARTRATQLRQQAQAAAARQADQTAWDATDKTKKGALQDYLSRFGNGAHAQEARGLIGGIDKQEADAQAAAQRAKEQREKEQKEQQEVASRAAADEQAIRRTVAAYESAYNGKDLKTLQGLWTDMPKSTSDAIGAQFRDMRTLSFQMRPTGPATVNGNAATVNCARVLSVTTRDGQRPPAVNDRVRVTLERAGANWVIRAITPY